MSDFVYGGVDESRRRHKAAGKSPKKPGSARFQYTDRKSGVGEAQAAWLKGQIDARTRDKVLKEIEQLNEKVANKSMSRKKWAIFTPSSYTS